MLNKRSFYSIIFILGMLFSHLAAAEDLEVQFGIGLMAFDYAEYDDGVFLDGETGLIPGVLLKLKKNHSKTYAELVGSFYSSKINYDGQTQGGIPLKTISEAIIIDTHFKLGYTINPISSYVETFYLGLGYRYWYRYIHPGQDMNVNPVAGVLEEYYWPYLLLGMDGHILKFDNIDVGIDFRYTKMLNAKMDIDFLGFCGYDNTSFNLGNRHGWRFSVPIKKRLNQKSTFLITPYYEIIDIGKSNVVFLTRDGALVDCNSDTFADSALEPRSETRNLGIEFTWVW